MRVVLEIYEVPSVVKVVQRTLFNACPLAALRYMASILMLPHYLFIVFICNENPWT